MESVISTIGSTATRAELPRQLLSSLERQVELLQQALEQQQRVQRQLMDRAFGPVDAVFDLLEDNAAMLRQQAEALQIAARNVELAATLMGRQAELFETATRTVRRPSDVLRSAAGASPRPERGPRRRQPPTEE